MPDTLNDHRFGLLSFELPEDERETILGLTQNQKNFMAIGLMKVNGEPLEGFYGTLETNQRKELMQMLFRWEQLAENPYMYTWLDFVLGKAA